MIAFIVWLVLGAFVGWIASMVMKTNHEQGTILNIVVGVVGAAVGGFLMRVLGANNANINNSFTLYGVIVSVFGAIVLLGIVNLFRRTAH